MNIARPFLLNKSILSQLACFLLSVRWIPMKYCDGWIRFLFDFRGDNLALAAAGTRVVGAAGGWRKSQGN